MKEPQHLRASRNVECLDLRSAEGKPIRFVVDLSEPNWQRDGVAAYDRRYITIRYGHGAPLARLTPEEIGDLSATSSLGPWSQENERPNPWVLLGSDALMLSAWWRRLVTWDRKERYAR